MLQGPRVSEVLGALASTADIASGFPLGKVLRTAILSATLARHAGHDARVAGDAYFLSLLCYLGCTGFSHEEAHRYGAGDDVALRNTMSMADATDKLGTLGRMMRGLAPEASLLSRGGAVARILSEPSAFHDHANTQCNAAIELSRIAGVEPSLLAMLSSVCERWDGRGEPNHLAGEAIPLPTRVHNFADVVEIAHHREGLEGALAVVGKRRGKQLDPTLSDVFVAHAADLDRALTTTTLWEDFVQAEPGPALRVVPEQVDGMARAIGYFSDLKSVHLLGHSQRVAELAATTAARLGMNRDEQRLLSWAGNLHDLGRVAVATGIWDRPGKLGALEWGEVRMHTHHTERVLALSPAWAAVRPIACAPHEHPRGTGYHRGLFDEQITAPMRVLMVCDAIAAMGERRAHRPALDREAILTEVRREVDAGRYRRDVVEAALDAAGLDHARPKTRERALPSGLSEREGEVLCWVARGKTNKEIGQILAISARTVQHHVAHIYDKIGAYSRAGAAIFAMEHRLLEE